MSVGVPMKKSTSANERESRERETVPVDDLEINNLPSLENVNTSLRSVDSRVRRIGAHRQFREEGRDVRHLEGDVVESSSVDSVVLCVVRHCQPHLGVKGRRGRGRKRKTYEGVEPDSEFNEFVGDELRFDVRRNPGIVHRHHELVFELLGCHRRGRVVDDGSGEICNESQCQNRRLDIIHREGLNK